MAAVAAAAAAAAAAGKVHDRSTTYRCPIPSMSPDRRNRHDMAQSKTLTFQFFIQFFFHSIFLSRKQSK